MRKLLVVMIVMLAGVMMTQGNLLLNPGFEAPVMTAWSPENETTNWFGWGDVEAVGSGWKTPQAGSQTVVMKNWLGAGDGIEQKPNVSADTAYNLSFYSLWDGGYDGSMDIQVRWLDAGGAQLASNRVSWTAGSADTWNSWSLTTTSVASSVRAEINMQNSGGTAGALYLDSVSFTAVAIPEPGTAALFGIVGLGLIAWRRRR